MSVNTDKIEKLELRIRQLLNEKKRLINQHKESERKARTKRLIERGALLESIVTTLDELSNEQLKRFLEKTLKTEYAQRILSEVKVWKPAAPKAANQTKITVEPGTSSNEQFKQITFETEFDHE